MRFIDRLKLAARVLRHGEQAVRDVYLDRLAAAEIKKTERRQWFRDALSYAPSPTYDDPREWKQ